jgi:tetratricopeptide (TPR) repeat protein
MCYAALENHDEAIINFNRAISLDRNNEEAYINRADSKVATGKDASALSDYNRIINLNPKNGYAYEGRAIYWFKKERFDLASEDFEKAIKFAPTGRAYFYRGAMRDMQGDNKGACEDLHEAVNLEYPGAKEAMERVCR